MPSSSNLSILIFVANLDVGGAEWVIVNLCNELIRSRDINIKLISAKQGRLIGMLDKEIEVIELRAGIAKSILPLLKEMILFKHDFVLVTQRGAAVVMGIIHAITFSNSQFIVREAAANFHSSLTKKNKLSNTVWRILYKYIYRSADLIIANSVSTYKSLIDSHIINPMSPKCKILDNPVNLELIKQKAMLPIDGEMKSHFEGQSTFICINRLTEVKQVDIIIQAFAVLKESHPYAILLVVGDGPEKNRLQTIVYNLGLTKCIFFLGKLENPYRYLNISDVLVLASNWEGFGMVVVEALALGVNVVTTNNGSGASDIIGNGLYGFLFENKSVESLSKAMIKALCTPFPRHLLIERANKYQLKLVVEQYWQAITGLKK